MLWSVGVRGNVARQGIAALGLCAGYPQLAEDAKYRANKPAPGGNAAVPQEGRAFLATCVSRQDFS